MREHQSVRRDYKGLVVALLKLLRSEQYPCPGEHSAAPRTGERHYEERRLDFETEWLAEHGYPADPEERYCILCQQRVWDYVQPYDRIPDMPHDPTYKGMGGCNGQITIETESEYGEFSMTPISTWPVASGPCSEALGLDDDEECNDPIFARWMERRSLLKAIENLAYRYHINPWDLKI